MKNPFNNHGALEELTDAVRMLALVIESGLPKSTGLTISDLDNLETRLNMKLSAIKAQVATAAASNTEAFDELGTRLADLQTKIDALVLAAEDPDVTDETFLADLNTVAAKAAQLADIVPGHPGETPPEPTPTV